MKEKTVSSTGLIRPIGIAPRIHDQRENCQSFFEFKFYILEDKNIFFCRLCFLFIYKALVYY